jgi:branched-chain amino acid transport system permease protein
MDTGNLALQYLLSGITKGGIYAVVAIGFNLIYSATGILNFAQGEFVMLGGMVAVTLAQFVPLPVAIAGSVLIVALVGCSLEVAFFRRLRRHSVLHMIIITIGLSIVMQEAALHLWDEKVRSLPYFTGNEVSSIKFFGAAISPQVLCCTSSSNIRCAAAPCGPARRIPTPPCWPASTSPTCARFPSA